MSYSDAYLENFFGGIKSRVLPENQDVLVSNSIFLINFQFSLKFRGRGSWSYYKKIGNFISLFPTNKLLIKTKNFRM